MIPKHSTGYAVRVAPRDWLMLLKAADRVAKRYDSATVTAAHVEIAFREGTYQ